MRPTRLWRNANFDKVDKTVRSALELAFKQEAVENYPPPHEDKTPAEHVASTPELADVYLSVDTSLGKDEILIKPTAGTPTGLTEIFQHPHPRESLSKVYDHTLAFLGEKFPTTSVYRTSVENLTKARQAILKGNTEILDIENKIGSGLVEEILIQAAEEFRLAEDLAKDKVWEDVEEKPLPDQWVAFYYNEKKE